MNSNRSAGWAPVALAIAWSTPSLAQPAPAAPEQPAAPAPTPAQPVEPTPEQPAPEATQPARPGDTPPSPPGALPAVEPTEAESGGSAAPGPAADVAREPPPAPTSPTPPTAPVAPTAPIAAPAAAAPPAPAPPATAASAEREVSGASEDAASSERWYDAFDLGAFVDAYFSINSNLPKPQDGRNGFRALDRTNGFGVSWVGLDLAYAPQPVGGVINLRFGPSAAVIAGDDVEYGLQYLKQAYASWRPGSESLGLQIDFGKFDTIYGREVAESQGNLNYTRSLLFNLGQPFFHTGLRVGYDFTDQLSGTLLAVNGWNNTVDNNAGKTFGLQLGYVFEDTAGDDVVEVSAGYLFGPEQSDLGTQDCPPGQTFDPAANGCVIGGTGDTSFPVDRGAANTDGLRHFIDVVVAATPTPALTLELDGSYGLEKMRIENPLGPTTETVSWYGARLAGRYGFTDVWALALRGELYRDPDGFTCGDVCQLLGIDGDAADGNDDEGLTLITGTLTVEANVVDPLLIRLEGRIDKSNEAVFPKIRTFEDVQLTGTLGVVVTTN